MNTFLAKISCPTVAFFTGIALLCLLATHTFKFFGIPHPPGLEDFVQLLTAALAVLLAVLLITRLHLAADLTDKNVVQPVKLLLDTISNCTGYVHFIPSKQYPGLAKELLSKHTGFAIFANVELIMFSNDDVFAEIWGNGIQVNSARLTRVVFNVQANVDATRIDQAKKRLRRKVNKVSNTIVSFSSASAEYPGEVGFLILGEEKPGTTKVGEIIVFAKHKALEDSTAVTYDGGFFWLRISEGSPYRQESDLVARIQKFASTVLTERMI